MNLNSLKVYTSNNYGQFKVVEYIDRLNVVVKFIDTGFVTKVAVCNIKKGEVKDKLHPSIYGVGFIGEGDYKASVNGKITKQYKTWSGMLERCYDPKLHKKRPSYIGCTVCTEWHDFQVYAKWHDNNYVDGYHLDKDIKLKGNKIYSPNTCMFVSASDNTVNAHAKHYHFSNPAGKVVDIYNLAEFCRENKLHHGAMSAVHLGKTKQHKGWRKYD